MAPSKQPLPNTAPSALVRFERERGVTHVQVTRGLAHVTVSLPKENAAGERLALLQDLAANTVSIFLIKLGPCAISFAVRADAVAPCESLLKNRGSQYLLLRDLGLVATVAGAMRDLSGVMARIYETMVGAGIRVRQTGDAYNAVLCLVAGDDVDRAAEALQNAFALGETERPDKPAEPDPGTRLKAL